MHNRSNAPSRPGAAVVLVLILLMALPAGAARIKDMADIKGVRGNQMVGYGLVVGLDGSGDGKNAKFTLQSMATMLEKMGMTVDPDDIGVDNVASVMVTAELPPFARNGSRIDVTVSSIGGAENLQGGTLLLTALKGVDGKVYAVAQGPVVTGGFSAGGRSGGSVQKNFPTVGRVVGGALIEREVPSHFGDARRLTLSLRQPDFTTAKRMTSAINASLFGDVARSLDAGTVEVTVPDQYRNDLVTLVSMIEVLPVAPDVEAKVVINERTGTVVMGADVRIATVAVAHGNLSIQIRETAAVSQPLPMSGGETVVTPESDISVKEGNAPIFLVENGVSIGDVVRALNALGVSPRDLVAIFQAIKAAGALQARLEII
jgi:flagellar P-ring protein precursor FlgI